MSVSKLTSASTPIQVQNKINEVIDNLGGGGSSLGAIYQKSAAAAATVALADDTVIYTHTPTANTTYTFSTTNLTDKSNVITFELVITMDTTVRTLTFNNVTWLNGETPGLSVASQTYLLVFRSFNGGTTWVGNLQGWF